MRDIYRFLDDHGIAYDRVDHAPVYTCEEAEVAVPELAGSHTKNLFVRDGKGRRHFLIVVGWEKRVDLKSLCHQLEVKKLGMASPARLRQYLGVDPGAVTVLGVLNDMDHQVEVLFDTEVWQAQALQCHPLVNTATLCITREGIERFLRVLQQPYRILDIPARSRAM